MSIIRQDYGAIGTDVQTQMLIAPVLAEMKADRQFAVGDQFIVDSVLYKITTAISVIGTPLVVDTNCELSDTITQQMGYNNPNLLIPSSIRQTPTFETGFSSVGGRTYYYKIGTRVFVTVGLRKDDLSPIANELFFTLPEGYRPKSILCCAAVPYSTSTSIGYGFIYNTGEVKGRSDDSGCFFTLVYDAFA